MIGITKNTQNVITVRKANDFKADDVLLLKFYKNGICTKETKCLATVISACPNYFLVQINEGCPADTSTVNLDICEHAVDYLLVTTAERNVLISNSDEDTEMVSLSDEDNYQDVVTKINQKAGQLGVTLSFNYNLATNLLTITYLTGNTGDFSFILFDFEEKGDFRAKVYIGNTVK